MSYRIRGTWLAVMALLSVLVSVPGLAEEHDTWREPLSFRTGTLKEEGLECLVRLKDATAAFGTLRYAGDGVYQLTSENGVLSFSKEDIAALIPGDEARALKRTLLCMKNMIRLQAEVRTFSRRFGSARLKEMKQYFPLILYVEGITPGLIKCPDGGYYEVVDWFDFDVRCTEHGGVRSCRQKLGALGYHDHVNREILELLGLLLTIGIYR